ncbi:ATP synthase mitochondrial F1 complex assembly factor 2-like [Tubulanus polymorphus]|uniref:ATP synthase mitochondrial F1 complex assembly factor 2-like n=1 Tax=Tubulanus polymorphus TaxID=672921 RepID=UPI003DA1D7BA
MKIFRSALSLKTSLLRRNGLSLLRNTARFESTAENKEASIHKLQRELDKEIFTHTKTDINRFYKTASIVKVDGTADSYEILLDHRKLKTPGRNVFVVPNRALAHAVEVEWMSQEKKIERHTMHLTHLCNMAIDNPTKRTKETVVDGILSYLETDTLCYRIDEPEELKQYQDKYWNPIIEWAEKRYDVKLPCTSGFSMTELPEETKRLFRQHLLSHTEWSLVGYQYSTEALKSFVLSLALMDKHISVEDAVKLARLETVYQTDKWGSVEWYHDVEVAELQSKASAAAVFTHLCNETTYTKTKGQNN